MEWLAQGLTVAAATAAVIGLFFGSMGILTPKRQLAPRARRLGALVMFLLLWAGLHYLPGQISPAQGDGPTDNPTQTPRATTK